MSMTDVVSDFLANLKIEGLATVLHKPGAVRLDGYPLLVYAPAQWGDGIRTENNGTPVADIAIEAATNPSVEAVAAKFSVTPDHVSQALEYAAKASGV